MSLHENDAFEERARIQAEAESLLSAKNRTILREYEASKEQTALDLFRTPLLELDDKQFDQATNLARKLIPGAEKVLTYLAEIEDWLIEQKRKS